MLSWDLHIHFNNLTEIDFSHEANRDGLYAMSRLGWEVHKGVIPYAQYQHQRTDLEKDGTETKHYTIGAHFFPRPHFELSGQWSKVRTLKSGRTTPISWSIIISRISFI